MLKRIFSLTNSINISLVFIGLMFLLPFVVMHHSLPIPLFYSEWTAAALGLLALMPLLHTASQQTTPNQSVRAPQISLVFIGLAAIVCVQWALGMLHSSPYALLVHSYLTWAFLLTVLGSHLRQTLGWEKLAMLLAWSLVIGGIINIGIVALQLVTRTGGVIPWLPNLISYGAISQPNHFADFTALATASLIYLYAKGRLSVSFFWLILMCFLMMLSFSGSRSAWLYLAALATLAVLLQTIAKNKHAKSTETRLTFKTGLLLLPAFILAQLFIYHVLPNELVNLPTERLVESARVSGASIRLSVWYDSLRLFIQSPWVGIGTGAIRAESSLLLDYPTGMASKRMFEHAHNLFVHLLTEMGIVAFLIVLTGLTTWILNFKWRELNLETWWLLSLLSVLGIHSMLEYPLWFTYFLGIAAILLGAGDERSMSIHLPFNAKAFSSKYSHTVLCTGLTLALLMGIANLGTSLIANIKIEQWVEQYRFKNVNEQELIDWTRQYSLLSPYADLLSVMSMSVNPTDIDKKVRLSQSGLRVKPLRKVSYQHALLLELQGDHVNALKQLNRTLIAYPADIKEVLGYVPAEYRQRYLDLLYEARPAFRDAASSDMGAG